MKTTIEKITGHVLTVTGDVFCARLTDDKENEFEAEIAVSVLEEGEKQYLQPGAIFVWYFVAVNKISFCDEVWTQEEIDAAEKEAKEIFKKLRWVRS